MPRLRDAAPDAGAYGNEADWEQADWHNSSYGSSYDKLKGIKMQYDPHGVFYAKTGVGSEGWYQRDRGRLCKTGCVSQSLECLTIRCVLNHSSDLHTLDLPLFSLCF